MLRNGLLCNEKYSPYNFQYLSSGHHVCVCIYTILLLLLGYVIICFEELEYICSDTAFVTCIGHGMMDIKKKSLCLKIWSLCRPGLAHYSGKLSKFFFWLLPASLDFSVGSPRGTTHIQTIFDVCPRVSKNVVSSISWQYLVISDMQTKFRTQFIGMTNSICLDISDKYEIFLLLAFISHNYASVKRQKEKVDNCLGTWRHNTKFTSWINTSYNDKLHCTVYSAI